MKTWVGCEAQLPIIEECSISVSPVSGVRLQVAVVQKLNLADFQNAVPALHELAIVNETRVL